MSENIDGMSKRENTIKKYLYGTLIIIGVLTLSLIITITITRGW